MTIMAMVIFVAAVVLAVTLELWFAYLDSKLVGFPEWPLGLWTLAFWICVVVVGGAAGLIVKIEVSQWLPLLCVGFIHTLINFCCEDSILTFRGRDTMSGRSCDEGDGNLKNGQQVRCAKAHKPDLRKLFHSEDEGSVGERR